MKKTFISFISITLVFAFQYANAQVFDRYVIGSAGTFATSVNGSMSWTIGEVVMETYSSSNNSFTQGFHQPDTRVAEPLVWDFFIPEGFSPNGDGVNDPFVIRGISHYPKNTFVIFNRWGNKVFETVNYQNTWDGTCTKGFREGGDELPVALDR